MAFYKSPIRPFDPVIESDQKTGASRYYRDGLSGSGQDSFTNPPAQDQAQWQKLWDNMPISNGTLQKRWGYQLFYSAIGPVYRMYEYERVADGERRLLLAQTNKTLVIDENGATQGAGPVTSLGLVHRAVTSGNFAYFFDGNPADNLKWDGTDAAAAAGVTKWGIDVTTGASSSSFSDNVAGTVVDLADHGRAWGSLTNAKADDGLFASATSNTGGQPVNTMNLTNYSFAGITGTILGIQVGIKCRLTGGSASNGFWTVQLIKGGVLYGQVKSVTIPLSFVDTQYNTSLDLWGGTWLSTDFGATFGVQIVFTPFAGGGTTIQLDCVHIAVYYSASGNGIGSVVIGAAGLINLSIGRKYYYVLGNSKTGHFSDLSAVSASSGPCTNKQINLSAIPTATDPQVDQKIILATLDGGDETQLYFVTNIAPSTTTFTDNIPDTQLITLPQLLFTDPFDNEFGVAGNSPPPAGLYCTKHKGRLYMLVGDNLYFSKNQSELTTPAGFVAGKWEESWPADNFLNISQSSEQPTGLLSDGQNLYIGTARRVRRLVGDGPDNFADIDLVHNEVGVLSQEVWKVVYAQGQPMGGMWLTPDNRVVLSDFNTFTDAGHPIQDVLDTINSTAAPTTAYAEFFSDGEYDIYALAIPTGANTANDTLCVFDLRLRQWQIWHLTDQILAMLFHITNNGGTQWLIAAAGNPLYQLKRGLLSDRVNNTPVGFTSTAQTSWLHLGAPTIRKWLDEIEVIGDPNLTVTVEGANNQTDFSAPATIISNALLTQSPLGSLKVYLAAYPTQYRYYRFTFTSSTTAQDYLDAYNVLSLPINDQ